MKKYFVKPCDRIGSCYYEFYKGKWDGKTFWKNDSICIHNDDWYDCDFLDILIKYAPNYAPFGETEISLVQWESIKNDALLIGGEPAKIVLEANDWMLNTFNKYKLFTILGI